MKGWIAVQRGEHISYNLENSPLQIRTNSEVGRKEQVVLCLYELYENARVYSLGQVYLYFTSPPQFKLSYCNTNRTNFFTDLPPETEKVWTITLSSDSGERRVVIHCNDKEVLNVVLSDTTCDNTHWRDIWSRAVGKIYFLPSDTASDYYRRGKLT